MIARVIAVSATALVIAGLLVGCTQGVDSLGEPGQNYVSGDGTVTEFPLGNRGDPIEFTGATETGEIASSEDYLGDVLVVNFWYATCPPCRLEAPWLEELNQKYAPDGVQFLGVNIRDGAETAQVFAENFGITYPSIIDSDGLVTLAFSGLASPT
ncbi:MAG: TlpA disulfide reductase family protein, partial [Rhodoglobus sp.]|nr:TlpA disulfide reductase family protein [Rhodoglobus sp.]